MSLSNPLLYFDLHVYQMYVYQRCKTVLEPSFDIFRHAVCRSTLHEGLTMSCVVSTMKSLETPGTAVLPKCF